MDGETYGRSKIKPKENGSTHTIALHQNQRKIPGSPDGGTARGDRQ
ncbi:hypothetical protein ACE1CD_23010 [Aerosakkonema sp. BLCC-F183]